MTDYSISAYERLFPSGNHKDCNWWVKKMVLGKLKMHKSDFLTPVLVVVLRNIKLGTDIVCFCKIASMSALVPMAMAFPSLSLPPVPLGSAWLLQERQAEAFRAQPIAGGRGREGAQREVPIPSCCPWSPSRGSSWMQGFNSLPAQGFLCLWGCSGHRNPLPFSFLPPHPCCLAAPVFDSALSSANLCELWRLVPPSLSCCWCYWPSGAVTNNWTISIPIYCIL